MPKYGRIVNGELVISESMLEGYKPIEYAKIPEFDQTAQAVFQGEVTESKDKIHVGVEVRNVEMDDEFEDEFI